MPVSKRTSTLPGWLRQSGGLRAYLACESGVIPVLDFQGSLPNVKVIEPRLLLGLQRRLDINLRQPKSLTSVNAVWVINSTIHQSIDGDLGS